MQPGHVEHVKHVKRLGAVEHLGHVGRLTTTTGRVRGGIWKRCDGTNAGFTGLLLIQECL